MKLTTLPRIARRALARLRRKHWFLFTYVGPSQESGRTCVGHAVTGYPTRAINLSANEENKAHAGVTDEATAVSVSYLGKMTRRRMMAGREAQKRDYW